MKAVYLTMMFLGIVALSFAQQATPVNYDYLCQTWILKKAAGNGKVEEMNKPGESCKFTFGADSTIRIIEVTPKNTDTTTGHWKLNRSTNKLKFIFPEHIPEIKIMKLEKELLVLYFEESDGTDKFELTLVAGKK